MSDFETLRRGDGVLCRFGSRGTQLGVVYGRDSRRVLVVKWREKSKSWTGRVKLHQDSFLRRATPDEITRHTQPIPFDLWSGKK